MWLFNENISYNFSSHRQKVGFEQGWDLRRELGYCTTAQHLSNFGQGTS
jgi:hypothetical protein